MDESNVTDDATVTGVPILLSEPADGVPPVVDTQSMLESVAARLADGHGPVALDAERASGFRYGQRAFLIQLRRADTGTALLDPVGISDFQPLGEALAGTEWILHAANQDLPCLAELGLRPDKLFDTELAARLLGFPKVGLASLTEELLGIQLAKTHGAADWSRRPLPPAWLSYAALDVELLHDLRLILLDRLAQADRGDWAEQEFTALLDFKPRFHPEPWRRTSGMHKVKDPRRAAIVRSLWQKREQIAEHIDRAPGRLLPDAAVIAAAQAEPVNLKALSELPAFERHHRRLRQWWSAVESAYALAESELPQPPVPDGPPPKRTWQRRKPEAARRFSVVREFILGQADEAGITAEVLITPDLVRRIVWDPPADQTVDSIAQWLLAAGARSWQVELVAAGIADGLSESPEEPSS